MAMISDRFEDIDCFRRFHRLSGGGEIGELCLRCMVCEDILEDDTDFDIMAKVMKEDMVNALSRPSI